MLVISVRQPWAWAIIHGGKDIENRNWPTKVRGRVLIHAGKQYAGDDEATVRNLCPDFPGRHALSFGGVIGSVEIVDCVEGSGSAWFEGRYAFVLRRPIALPFTPLPGKLGFFKAPAGEFPGMPDA